MLTKPDELVALYILCDGAQADLLHNLPWHQGQNDRSVVLQTFLSSLRVDVRHICKCSCPLGPLWITITIGK